MGFNKDSVDKNLTNFAALKDLIVQLCSESTPLAETKEVLAHLGTKLEKMKGAECKEICDLAIEKLAARGGIFPREDAIFKRELAMVFDSRGDLDSAVRTLSSIQYDNAEDQIVLKTDDYLTLAEMWFERDDATQAEIFVNRASHMIYDERIQLESQLRYKRAFIKVSDSKRDYTNAAQGYYNLSTEKGVDAAEANELFNLGLVCSILAPAGPRKDRLLTLLLKDERAKLSVHQDLLQKFATGSVIKPAQTKKFQESLQVHQQIRFSDGYTSLDKALIEHNMQVLSKIYLNITFAELGNFLGISSAQAETIIAKMIGEQRVHGVLDQINQLVEFDEVSQQQSTLNSQIHSVCSNVDSLSKDMLKAYPALAQHNKFVF